MNPHRLAELQRQRDLIREHLAWLDREIAREQGGLPVIITPRATTSSPTPAPSTLTPPSAPAAPAVANLPVPPPDPKTSALAARRGCFTAFFAAFAFIVLIFFAIYFLRYRDRPLLRVTPTTSQPVPR